MQIVILIYNIPTYKPVIPLPHPPSNSGILKEPLRDDWKECRLYRAATFFSS